MKKILYFVAIITLLFTGIFSASAQQNPTQVTAGISQTPGSGLTPCTDAKSEDCYQLLEPLPQKQEDGTYKYVDNFAIGTQGKDNQGIAGFINFMFEIGIGIAGVLGVVMLTIYGFQYASNDKNINTFAELKSKITNVIFGILLLLGIFIILRTINPDLLIVEPDIAKQLLQLEKTAVKDSYGNPVLTGGGEEYDPTGKNDVQKINKNISDYDSYFKKYALQYGISCNLLKATMYRESGGNPKAVSSAGAKGLMQFMDGTSAHLGFTAADMFIPEKAINAGAKYYKELTTNGCNTKKSNSVCNTSNTKYVVAAYNAGAGANRVSSRCDNQTAWECVLAPDFKETRKYVPIVLNNALELKSRGWGCE
jgi:hypothetical protein